MKNILLFISIFIITTIYSYFPGSKFIYASKAIISSPFSSENAQKSQPHYSRAGKPRIFKITEISENENTAYNSEVKNKVTLIDSDLSKMVPWTGSNLVVIDPGHGGEEPGADVNGLLEKNINLDVALRLDAILKEKGINTYMTRNDDSYVELKKRIYTANDKNAALFISIHSNWFRDSSLNGTMTLYYPSSKLCAGYLSEIDYANIIQSELMKALETKDRGIIDRPNLAVLRHANMPSVLVELGFMSNKSEAKLLASDSFKQKAAEALAEGITKSLKTVYSGKQN